MIRCNLCPHRCVLKEGQTGFCHQRINKEGSIVLKDYGVKPQTLPIIITNKTAN